jgi:tetratricopeptide (TPR) repeat protein
MKASAQELVSEGLRDLEHGTAEGNAHAVDVLNQALDVDSGLAAAHAALAAAYVQRTDDLLLGRAWIDPAIAAGRRALELDPSLREACVALGRAYRLKGRLKEERELWERRLRVAPDDADARERLGWVLWFTGGPDEALPWLDAAAAQRPQRAWTQFFLGNAYIALEDFARAEQSYGHALALDPSHSSAQAGLIWSLLAAGRDQDARRHLRLFQESTFDGDRYSLKIADLECFLGDAEAARRHAIEAIAEPSRDSSVGGAERYWPRGVLASTILGALTWRANRASAQVHLDRSELIDRERIEGGDQGYMPHIDLAAIQAIRGETRDACRSLRAAIQAGWRGRAFSTRDPLFENAREDGEFGSLIR